jgi:hypothetical protein
MRRMHWRFKLIDGSVVEGSTKGQPVFVELTGKVYGPFILGERMKGQDGQTLEDLVYVRKIVVSRRMMDLVIAEKKTAEPGGKGNSGTRNREQGTRNLTTALLAEANRPRRTRKRATSSPGSAVRDGFLFSFF